MLEKYVGTTVVVGDVGKIKMSENWEQSFCRRIGHNNFVRDTNIREMGKFIGNGAGQDAAGRVLF